MGLHLLGGGASGLTQPYLGPVANRGRLAGNNINATIYKQMMSWRRYRAADDIPAAALVYCSAQGTSESGVTATGTISASIEYPMGTYTRITFDSADTGEVTPTALLESDLTSLPTTIPKGAVFWVGTHVAWGTGTTPRYQDRIPMGAMSTAARESVHASSTTVTDTTLTGVRTNSGANTFDTYGPAAILGMTRRPTVFLAGDSRTQAQLTYSTIIDADGLQGDTEQLVGLRMGYINAGIGQDAYALANANYTQRLALSGYCSHILDAYGVNDAYANAVATELGVFTTFRDKFPDGKPYYKTTVIPKVTGRWSLADLSDQTPVTGWSNANDFNTLIRNGLNGLIDGYVDLEAATSPGIGTGKIMPAERAVTDAAITSGANTLTSTSGNFTAADVGKLVGIAGAGASGAYFVAVIGTVTNSTTVTLVSNVGTASNAGTTVSGAVAGIGLHVNDGTHQTSMREQALRRDVRLLAQLDPLLSGSA